MDVDSGSTQKKPKAKDPNDLSEYKLDDYDEEDAGDSGELDRLKWRLHFHPQVPGGLFSNIKGLTYYKDNEEDPYITLKDVRRFLSSGT